MTQAGEVLFRAGDTTNDFFVVLDGEVRVVDDFAGEVRTMGVFGPGTFLGDLYMLTGQGVPLSAVVSEGGELLAIPRERLKKVVTEESKLSNLILDTFMARRLFLMRTGVGLRLIGSRHSRDATRLREFAIRNRLPHVWIEVEEDRSKAEALLERFGATLSEAPVAIWQGEDVLTNPTTPELARIMGVKVDFPREKTYDLIVVGAGPAGFGAAVYGASEGLATLALESVALGGQAGTSSRIENYLGFPVGLSGFELATRALAQADKFGAQTAVPEEAVRLRRVNGHYRIGLAEGAEIVARSVIAATGARYQRLDVPGLAQFEGVSVHYAATESEVQRCEGEEVVVVGGGNSAGQAAVYLAGRARRVYLLIRGGDLSKGMSTYLVDRVRHAENVELLAHTEVELLVGTDRLDQVVVRDNRTGEGRSLDAKALFVFIGAQANTGWLRGTAELDRRGFVLTGRAMADFALEGEAWQGLSREPYRLETSMPGVFAAGDVRSGSIKRCASAVGEGAMAVALVHQYLAETGV
ncbi:FAD-dependent oxidoreductase [Georgenia yuyongxinii]|uniref:FAD-dependent oxidoreductase n=1 Tax=Georgenia yuyongxinii TaxID=2589797 RepID=UPI00362CA557